MTEIRNVESSPETEWDVFNEIKSFFMRCWPHGLGRPVAQSGGEGTF